MKKEEGEEERTVKRETKGRDERREGGERRGRNIDMKLSRVEKLGRRRRTGSKKKECADICRGEEEGEGRGAEG